MRAPGRSLVRSVIVAVALVASTVGCASVLGQAGANRVAGPPDARDRRVTAISRPDVLHRPGETAARYGGQRATLETTRPRPGFGMTDLHVRAVEPARQARSAAEDRVVLSPAIGAKPDADVAAGRLRPGPWTRDRWTILLTEVLSNERLARAAMWMGSGPVRVRVSAGGFFVALRLATP